MRASHDELEPAHALIRSWCGVEEVERFEEMERLTQELERLQKVILDAALWIDRHGHSRKAASLRRVVSLSTHASRGC